MVVASKCVGGQQTEASFTLKIGINPRELFLCIELEIQSV